MGEFSDEACPCLGDTWGDELAASNLLVPSFGKPRAFMALKSSESEATLTTGRNFPVHRADPLGGRIGESTGTDRTRPRPVVDEPMSTSPITTAPGLSPALLNSCKEYPASSANTLERNPRLTIEILSIVLLASREDDDRRMRDRMRGSGRSVFGVLLSTPPGHMSSTRLVSLAGPQ